jgi:hypothetical protein
MIRLSGHRFAEKDHATQSERERDRFNMKRSRSGLQKRRGVLGGIPLKSFVSLLTAGFIVIAYGWPASAQERVYQAQSGRPISIRTVFSCTWGNYQSVSGTANNGSVVTTHTTAPRCGKPNHPITNVVYTSRPGFKGQDEATIYGDGVRDRVKIIVR